MLSKSIITVNIKGQKLNALIDTGSSDNFIHPDVVQKFSLPKFHRLNEVSMASTTHCNQVSNYTVTDIVTLNNNYSNISFIILENLCVDIILGLDFQEQHKKVTFNFGGQKQPIEICSLTALKVEPPDLFANLSADCHPVATKSRRYNSHDRNFINNEVQRLLEADIIEPSNSPWRAQVVVTKNENHKKRLVFDYSETVNKFTQLDAYPLPRIDDLVNKIAQYKVFSSIDLKSAYHQIPLKDADKPFTAFEANGGLYQFKRMPLGVTNGVSCFQRSVDKFITDKNILSTFAYLDNIYVCGHDQEEHDQNLKLFLKAAKEQNWTFNENKCTYSTRKLNILGNFVEEGTIKPDPERFQPLRDLPIPHNTKSLKRIMGLFSHYSKWIPKFSDLIAPLVKTGVFPLNAEAKKAFQKLKIIIENAVVLSIDESLPFELECDASNIALAGVLNQSGRPVAFFSRTLHDSELKWPSVEKEACAIVEAVRYWRHYLTGRRFTLKTDQKSVSYMFNSNHKSKIKNDKIYRWRLELSCYTFDIEYRPGKEMIAPDTFTRAYCSMTSTNSLYQFHNSLCHPGITRMTAFVRSRNLPFSVEDIRKLINNCAICQKSKPRFFKPSTTQLIKATQPMERLNIDFKGPLPSTSPNKYILTVVDEYTRFPFAIPCKNVNTEAVISSLYQIFSIFGMPTFIHSDRGAAFMSKELRDTLHTKGIATSRTTPYNPQGNGLVERYNGIIWKSVVLALESRNLPSTMWEVVLPDALHSIRTLISTSTGSTPHERMFKFQRRTSTGVSIPSWLSKSGPVLLKKFNRSSKYDPLVDEVELLEANPQYAFIKHSDGRESTVSLRHLAPIGETTDKNTVLSENNLDLTSPQQEIDLENNNLDNTFQSETVIDANNAIIDVNNGYVVPQSRRSTRNRKAPDRLDL